MHAGASGIARVSYFELRSGWVELNGRYACRTAPLSATMTREVAQVLKEAVVSQVSR